MRVASSWQRHGGPFLRHHYQDGAGTSCQDRAGTGRSGRGVSIHTLKPLDKEGIAKVLAKFDCVIVVEECSPQGSLACQVKALATRAARNASVHTCSLQDDFIHFYGSHGDLLKQHGLHPELMYKKNLHAYPMGSR